MESVQQSSVSCTAYNFLPSLIELSGSSFQHEDGHSIHVGWDTSVVQEIIDDYII